MLFHCQQHSASKQEKQKEERIILKKKESDALVYRFLLFMPKS